MPQRIIEQIAMALECGEHGNAAEGPRIVLTQADHRILMGKLTIEAQLEIEQCRRAGPGVQETGHITEHAQQGLRRLVVGDQEATLAQFEPFEYKRNGEFVAALD